jgi:regulator of RNase E activity RraA
MQKPTVAALDQKLIERIHKQLFVAVLSDMLDSVGYRNQAFPSRIRCLDDDLMLVGRARTALYHDIYQVEPDKNPYELEIALVDDLKPGEVAVFACGATGRIAPWGGLLTTAARQRGAVGCVTDGCTRDIKAIRKMKFPVFHGGIAPLDSKGRGAAAAIDIPVECAGVSIKSGDLIVGDADGVVAIPHEIEDEVLAKAFARIDGENETEAALKRGEKLGDVYRRLGVL